MFKSIIALFQALLFIVSSFAVPDSNFKFMVDRAAYDLMATSEVSFDTMTADEMQVSQVEKENCREWYEENILCEDNPAYDFKYGMKSFRNNLKDWSFDLGDEVAVRAGKSTVITLTHKDNGLVATVEATIYEESASCEWTVFITNTAEENSPVISKLYAADCTLPTGKKADIYYSKGSEPAPDDFELLQSKVTATGLRFNANGGRTESCLPYFNLIGENSGIVLAVGWSGQWLTKISQGINDVKIKVCQETLKG